MWKMARYCGNLDSFAEVGERPYADGCDTRPVAFLEGRYVDFYIRNHHVGHDLIAGVDACIALPWRHLVRNPCGCQAIAVEGTMPLPEGISIT